MKAARRPGPRSYANPRPSGRALSAGWPVAEQLKGEAVGVEHPDVAAVAGVPGVQHGEAFAQGVERQAGVVRAVDVVAVLHPAIRHLGAVQLGVAQQPPELLEHAVDRRDDQLVELIHAPTVHVGPVRQPSWRCQHAAQTAQLFTHGLDGDVG